MKFGKVLKVIGGAAGIGVGIATLIKAFAPKKETEDVIPETNDDEIVEVCEEEE